MEPNSKKPYLKVLISRELHAASQRYSDIHVLDAVGTYSFETDIDWEVMDFWEDDFAELYDMDPSGVAICAYKASESVRPKSVCKKNQSRCLVFFLKVHDGENGQARINEVGPGRYIITTSEARLCAMVDLLVEVYSRRFDLVWPAANVVFAVTKAGSSIYRNESFWASRELPRFKGIRLAEGTVSPSLIVVIRADPELKLREQQQVVARIQASIPLDCLVSFATMWDHGVQGGVAIKCLSNFPLVFDVESKANDKNEDSRNGCFNSVDV